MTHSLRKPIVLAGGLVFVVAYGLFLSIIVFGTVDGKHVSAQTVLGDDDEREDDEWEDDEASTRSSGSSSSAKAVTTYVTKYETRQVSKVVTVTPPEYGTDTDGDGLVDAIDPDPNRPQKDYFTDSDGDSVPDAYDRHPGEDDLAYVESGTDQNGNGIVDAYEIR